LSELGLITKVRKLLEGGFYVASRRIVPTINVTAQAPTPKARMKSEYPNPCLNNAIKNATGVAKLIGVKAVPTVRGNRKIPTSVRTPRIAKAPPRPELKSEPSEVSTVQAAPRYEKSKPKPAMNPIIQIVYGLTGVKERGIDYYLSAGRT
jgi:hypothetical protein